jgi:hypothetical protein
MFIFTLFFARTGAGLTVGILVLIFGMENAGNLEYFTSILLYFMAIW